MRSFSAFLRCLVIVVVASLVPVLTPSLKRQEAAAYNQYRDSCHSANFSRVLDVKTYRNMGLYNHLISLAERLCGAVGFVQLVIRSIAIFLIVTSMLLTFALARYVIEEIETGKVYAWFGFLDEIAKACCWLVGYNRMESEPVKPPKYVNGTVGFDGRSLYVLCEDGTRVTLPDYFNLTAPALFRSEKEAMLPGSKFSMVNEPKSLVKIVLEDGTVIGRGVCVELYGQLGMLTATHCLYSVFGHAKTHVVYLEKDDMRVRFSADWKLLFSYKAEGLDVAHLVLPMKAFSVLGVRKAKMAKPLKAGSATFCMIYGNDVSGKPCRSEGVIRPVKLPGKPCQHHHTASTLVSWSGSPLYNAKGEILAIHTGHDSANGKNICSLVPGFGTKPVAAEKYSKESFDEDYNVLWTPSSSGSEYDPTDEYYDMDVNAGGAVVVERDYENERALAQQELAERAALKMRSWAEVMDSEEEGEDGDESVPVSKEALKCCQIVTDSPICAVCQGRGSVQDRILSMISKTVKPVCKNEKWRRNLLESDTILFVQRYPDEFTIDGRKATESDEDRVILSMGVLHRVSDYLAVASMTQQWLCEQEMLGLIDFSDGTMRIDNSVAKRYFQYAGAIADFDFSVPTGNPDDYINLMHRYADQLQEILVAMRRFGVGVVSKMEDCNEVLQVVNEDYDSDAPEKIVLCDLFEHPIILPPGSKLSFDSKPIQKSTVGTQTEAPAVKVSSGCQTTECDDFLNENDPSKLLTLIANLQRKLSALKPPVIKSPPVVVEPLPVVPEEPQQEEATTPLQELRAGVSADMRLVMAENQLRVAKNNMAAYQRAVAGYKQRAEQVPNLLDSKMRTEQRNCAALEATVKRLKETSEDRQVFQGSLAQEVKLETPSTYTGTATDKQNVLMHPTESFPPVSNVDAPLLNVDQKTDITTGLNVPVGKDVTCATQSADSDCVLKAGAIPASLVLADAVGQKLTKSQKNRERLKRQKMTTAETGSQILSKPPPTTATTETNPLPTDLQSLERQIADLQRQQARLKMSTGKESVKWNRKLRRMAGRQGEQPAK